MPALIRGTLDSLSRLREHPDLKAYSDGSGAYDWRRHEVPFSLLATDGSILRGVIDCVVKHDQGIDVIEFKTGRPQPDHERQLAVYVEAAQALFSEFHVTGRLIYTH